MAIGLVTAHLEELLSRAGVMAAVLVEQDPSRGVRRAWLWELDGGWCSYASTWLRRRVQAWRGPVWGFRAGLGVTGRGEAQPSSLQGHLDQAGSGRLAGTKSSLPKPAPKDAGLDNVRGLSQPAWSFDSVFGAVLPRQGAGQCWRGWHQRLAEPIPGCPCRELNCPCPMCGGVCSARSFNSLMTAQGQCPRPAPARPRPPARPRQEGWDWQRGAAAGSLPCPQTKGDQELLTPKDLDGLLRKAARRAGIRAAEVKHPPGLLLQTHLSGLQLQVLTLRR